MKEKVYKNFDEYRRSLKKEKRLIISVQIILLFAFLCLWEIGAELEIINTFLLSRPSDILQLLWTYLKNGSLFHHVKTSLLETLFGLILGTGIGMVIAILFWWFPMLNRILDPYMVVLNALPKTALAPILIIWAGTGMKGIVVVAISLSLVITILSTYNYFQSVDQEKIKMMKTFNASKWQILTKLIIPSNLANLINVIKINIGMAWVGVIVGEFLVSREGIGYLVVYGGQVFRLDLVMMGVLVLGFLAFIMYFILNCIEKYFRTYQYKKRRRK